MLNIMKSIYFSYLIIRNKYLITKELFNISNLQAFLYKKKVTSKLNLFQLLIIKIIEKKCIFKKIVNKYLIPSNINRLININFFIKYLLIILKKKKDSFFTLIITYDFDKHIVDKIKLSIKNNIKLVVSSKKTIKKLIQCIQKPIKKKFTKKNTKKYLDIFTIWLQRNQQLLLQLNWSILSLIKH